MLFYESKKKEEITTLFALLERERERERHSQCHERTSVVCISYLYVPVYVYKTRKSHRQNTKAAQHASTNVFFYSNDRDNNDRGVGRGGGERERRVDQANGITIQDGHEI